MQQTGTIRAEIAGHGQFETSATSLDELINRHWEMSLKELSLEIKDRMGDQSYDTSGLSKIELMLIIAELDGLATN